MVSTKVSEEVAEVMETRVRSRSTSVSEYLRGLIEEDLVKGGDE